MGGRTGSGADGGMAAQQFSRSSLANDPRARGIVYQGLLAAGLIALMGMGWRNVVVNMQARGIPMGFGFWDEIAGFDINQSLIDYSAVSTYGRAFWVGLINTLLVGATRHRAGDAARLRRRRGAAVAELDPVEGRARLCRTDAQHAAAAATGCSGTTRC